MNSGSLELSIYITLFIAAAVFVFIPAARAMSRPPAEIPATAADFSDGTACELPPAVELGRSSSNGEYPLIDMKKEGDFETATFAMG